MTAHADQSDNAPQGLSITDLLSSQTKECGCPPGACAANDNDELEEGFDSAAGVLGEVADRQDRFMQHHAVGQLGAILNNLTFATGIYARLVDEVLVNSDD
jgi:hypothetical protein